MIAWRVYKDINIMKLINKALGIFFLGFLTSPATSKISVNPMYEKKKTKAANKTGVIPMGNKSVKLFELNAGIAAIIKITITRMSPTRVMINSINPDNSILIQFKK
jgi:hypothetical protein